MDKSVVIAAVGDIGLIGKIAEDILKKGAEFSFFAVKPALSKADIVFGNLEIPFAEIWMNAYSREIPIKLKALPESVSALKQAGFNVVSLANNHIMDYGRHGLEMTTKLLEENGIRYVGAGHNLEKARQPVILSKNGFRVGFLSYAQKGRHSAGLDSPGAAYIQKEIIAEDLKALVPNVDWLVVSLHFGMIYCDYPRQEDQILARWIIDNGASIILGHHPHVIQGIEEYNGGVIIYSLGEFIFDPTAGNVYATFAKEIRRQSLIMEINLGKKDFKINPIPVFIGNNYYPETCKAEVKEIILSRLKNISEPLKNYNIDFGKHVASRTVKHNIKVLWFHIIGLNWEYVIQKFKRLRLCHVSIFLKYLKSIILKML